MEKNMSNKQQIHLFKDKAGNLHEWTMEDVIESGTPVDGETGDDMEYVGPKIEPFKLLVEVEMSGGCLEDINVVSPKGMSIDLEYVTIDHDDISDCPEDFIEQIWDSNTLTMDEKTHFLGHADDRVPRHYFYTTPKQFSDLWSKMDAPDSDSPDPDGSRGVVVGADPSEFADSSLRREWVKAINEYMPACDGCDGSGIRPDATNHSGRQEPKGYLVVEKCDTCNLYQHDLDAALAYGDDAHEISTKIGTMTVCLPWKEPTT